MIIADCYQYFEYSKAQIFRVPSIVHRRAVQLVTAFGFFALKASPSWVDSQQTMIHPGYSLGEVLVLSTTLSAPDKLSTPKFRDRSQISCWVAMSARLKQSMNSQRMMNPSGRKARMNHPWLDQRRIDSSWFQERLFVLKWSDCMCKHVFSETFLLIQWASDQFSAVRRRLRAAIWPCRWFTQSVILLSFNNALTLLSRVNVLVLSHSRRDKWLSIKSIRILQLFSEVSRSIISWWCWGTVSRLIDIHSEIWFSAALRVLSCATRRLTVESVPLHCCCNRRKELMLFVATSMMPTIAAAAPKIDKGSM